MKTNLVFCLNTQNHIQKIMVLLAEKYKPTTQKSLFHKDVVNHIRKWILSLDLSSSKQKILLCCGPVGSGKTVIIDILFKSFNLIKLDTTDIRSDFSQHLHNIVNYDTHTLDFIKSKGNLIFLDNIELCEKYITKYVEYIHSTLKANVPIIMLCNTPKLKESFASLPNCTTLDVKNPSLLELRKLVDDINIKECLRLDNDQIFKIIKTSQHDIRQVFNILEQWKLNTLANFDVFYKHLQEKPVDIDLNDKVCYLLDPSKPIDVEMAYTMSSTEPLSISNSIYQNYLLNDIPLNALCNIIDSISSSNIIFTKIFEEQCWQLYDLYTLHSCVMPSVHIKSTKVPFSNLFYYLKPYKDVSQNFANSLNDVRKTCMANMDYKRLSSSNVSDDIFRKTKETNLVSQMCIHNLKIVHNHFETQKRGKNTTKEEKFEMCENIENASVKSALDMLVNFIFEYKLFELDIDTLIINRNTLDVKRDINLLELKMFKRFLNIFTINNTFVLKSHLELALKYFIFKAIVDDINIKNQNRNLDNIESLIEDLSNIWNI